MGNVDSIPRMDAIAVLGARKDLLVIIVHKFLRSLNISKKYFMLSHIVFVINVSFESANFHAHVLPNLPAITGYTKKCL